MLQRFNILLLIFIVSLNSAYSMEDRSSNLKFCKENWPDLFEETPSRHIFDGLATNESVIINVKNGKFSRRVPYFRDGGEFKAPNITYSSHKQNLRFESCHFFEGQLKLEYSYIPGRLGGISIGDPPRQYIQVLTVVPENYPRDLETQQNYELRKIIPEQEKQLKRTAFIETYGNRLSDPFEKMRLEYFSGLIPVELYRTAFDGFQTDENVVLYVTDKLSASSPRTRKVAFKIYGGEEKRQFFINQLRPHKTAVVANLSFLEIVSIDVVNGNLILEFGYYESNYSLVNTARYFTFKVFTTIPKKYPHEDQLYMPETIVNEKVNSPISEGLLARKNARDIGEIFSEDYRGLVLRSQNLSPQEIDEVRTYVDLNNKHLKTVMNLNIHGFGGGHIAEDYSMVEIDKCQKENLVCLHPYHSDPQRRAYVDGVDPRTIPVNSKDRGNVYARKTVNYFITKENLNKLGMKFNDNTQEWGHGDTDEDFKAAKLEGNVPELLASVKNFIQAGLPGIFHCKGGIHRTGQVEAIFILLFATRDQVLPMWSNASVENLNHVYNSRFKGYLVDGLNYILGRSDKTFSEVVSGTWWDKRKLTPVEYNYVLSAQGNPRDDNIVFIRDFGKFAQAYDNLYKTQKFASTDEAYNILINNDPSMNWVSKDIFISWQELLQIFNNAIDNLLR